MKNRIIKILKEYDIDQNELIKEMFLGYKFRKSNNILYNNSTIPLNLIKIYYAVNNDETKFCNIKKAFMNKYIKNESSLEGVDEKQIHGKEEIEGLKAMYEYINSEEINDWFDVFTLKDLHKKLYSCIEFKEFGGTFRNSSCYLNNTTVDLIDPKLIFQTLKEIDIDIQKLIKKADIIKKYNNIDELINYLDECVIINCRLIKVHPFYDGNGRTIRGFTNKLFELAGLPFVYIRSNEREEYLKAMNKANNDDYKDIINFYRYKICDSIIELDINNKVKNENKEKVKKYF